MNVTSQICGDPKPNRMAKVPAPVTSGRRRTVETHYIAPTDPRYDWALKARYRARKARITNRRMAEMLSDIGFTSTPADVSNILNARRKLDGDFMVAIENVIDHVEWERMEAAMAAAAKKRDVIKLRGKV